METVLSVSGLSKEFGRIKAVNNLSLEVKQGQVFGMLGPNGSGKTTTLGMLMGVVNPTHGSFTWFKGGPDDRYISQYILTGVGHLKKLKALNSAGSSSQQLKTLVDKAIPYLDQKIKEDYAQLVKSKANPKDNHLSPLAIQYLYMRSFFPEYDIAPSSKPAVEYYRQQAKKYWLSNSKYLQAMIALVAVRSNDQQTADGIIKSLKENAIHHEELGMYWKEWNKKGSCKNL